MSAPINAEWGYDNRSVGLRVPRSNAANRRVENRFIGADTNPYLAIAASLASGYIGMKRGLKARDHVPGDSFAKGRDLPYSLLEAIEVFRQSEEMMELLGEKFVQMYSQIKSDEYDAFMQVISPWEREHLLMNRINGQFMATTLHLNDRPGSYPDSYYRATAVGLTERARLSTDTTAEVCIIGGGFTGLSSALHLAGLGIDVIVLDAHRMGWGASGQRWASG